MVSVVPVVCVAGLKLGEVLEGFLLTRIFRPSSTQATPSPTVTTATQAEFVFFGSPVAWKVTLDIIF